VENRLRHLLDRGEVESRVVAPVPWFFSKSARFGRYARYSRVPGKEIRHGIPIQHPRYPVVPKIGMTLAPFLLASATKPLVRRMIDEGYDFDILDAHYFYPDGVAAAIISGSLGKPFVVTARGSDLNQIAEYRVARKLIQWAANKATGLITVCQSLKTKLVSLGIASDRITVLRNGVDLNLFQPPEDRESLRVSLNLAGPTFLSVGNLIPLKGHDLVIRAIANIPGSTLLLVGEGPDQTVLRNLARELQLKDRVRFLGMVPHERIAAYYGAADALVLASEREGLANVLLESMACGTPVIATNVSGAPEVVTNTSAGILTEKRSVKAISEAMSRLLAAMPDRQATRRHASMFSWDETSEGLEELFHSLVHGSNLESERLAGSNTVLVKAKD
jgi:teichuronic acid biosynthesis glycosyltransferase TuaC